MFVFISLVSFFPLLIERKYLSFFRASEHRMASSNMCIYTLYNTSISRCDVAVLPLRHNINTYVCACEQKCSIRLCFLWLCIFSFEEIFILILRLLDDDDSLPLCPQHNILYSTLCYFFFSLHLPTSRIKNSRNSKNKRGKRGKKNRVIIKYTHFVRVGRIIYER